MIKNVSQKIGFSFSFFISNSRLGKCDFAECNPRESFNRKTRVIFPLASLYPCLTSIGDLISQKPQTRFVNIIYEIYIYIRK